jgi:hypothetical protein
LLPLLDSLALCHVYLSSAVVRAHLPSLSHLLCRLQIIVHFNHALGVVTLKGRQNQWQIDGRDKWCHIVRAQLNPRRLSELAVLWPCRGWPLMLLSSSVRAKRLHRSC